MSLDLQRVTMEQTVEKKVDGPLAPACLSVPEIQMAKLLARGGREFLDLAKSCLVPGAVPSEIDWVEKELN